MVHRRINDFLSCFIAALAAYILIWPVLPMITWYVAQPARSSQVLTVVTNVEPGRRVIIPSMRLSQDIHEGSDESALNEGVWRRPHTSTPPHGGNTVLAGHRFVYSNQEAVFYHLDKVKVGDQIVVEWDETRYFYTVKNIAVVQPDDIWIEGNETGSDLTLYTCTPLWSTAQRLVVMSELTDKVVADE